MKKPIWKRWWFWAIIVVIVFAIVAGSSDSSDEGAKKVEESKVEQTDTNKTDAAKKDTKDKEKDSKEKDDNEEFYVGDKVKLGDYAIKVTKVSYSNGSQYDKPKSGKVFVTVMLTIYNDGDDQVSYNPYDFSLQNSSGQVSDVTFTMIDEDTALNSGELVAGGTVKGSLTFEAPKNDKKLVLRYQPDFWSDKEIQIHLNKEK